MRGCKDGVFMGHDCCFFLLPKVDSANSVFFFVFNFVANWVSVVDMVGRLPFRRNLFIYLNNN